MDVSIANLMARYGDFVAVNDLSVDIPDGELLVLLGPSGCGKTTTMRCLAGLEVPQGGRITIGGQPVFDRERGINIAVNRRDVGMVFQSYAIWPHMSVGENVAFPLRMKGVSKQETRERVARTLEMVGLAEFADRSASLLSGGQMQRVAVARSVVAEPATLLLDEPLSNLDAELRDKLRFELREIQQHLGITTIYVTHDQAEAFALADRVAVMYEGRIVQIGKPAELYRRPSSSFLARFLGVDNVMSARIQSARSGECQVEIGGGTVLRAEAPATPSNGNIHVCIRAEDIKLHSSQAGEPPNVIPARVRSSTYLGDRTRYHMENPEVGSLFVTTPEKGSPYDSDSELLLELPPDQLFVVPD